MTITTTWLTYTTLTATLAIASGFLAPPFSTTLITEDVGPSGEVLARPIHTPAVVLRPENTVARTIQAGEAMRCNVSLVVKAGTVEGMDADIRSVVLECDGARWTVVGIQFERSAP